MNIKELKGMKTKRVYESTFDGNECIVFETDNDDVYILGHFQECCESVNIDDICGDLRDLEGVKIWGAEETSNGTEDEWGGVSTWTFYHVRSIKGTVTIRFYGHSNGYYSTKADFFKCDNAYFYKLKLKN